MAPGGSWHLALPCAELTVMGTQCPHQPSLVILGAGGAPGEPIAGSSLGYLFSSAFPSLPFPFLKVAGAVCRAGLGFFRFRQRVGTFKIDSVNQ